ncbi:MAG TPA: low molecular weight phosphatase family protein [Candidatus Acidoferrum sp.]|jgi:arsenate reductase
MKANEQSPQQQHPQKLRVMFVCIGNSCRSPMAESIAIRDAADLFESSSAGLSPLGVVQKLTLETLQRNGYPIDALQSKAIRKEEWADADLIINMSGYSKQRTFPHTDWQKVEDWDVEDPYGSEPAVYQRTFEDIQTRIDELATRLRKRQT